MATVVASATAAFFVFVFSINSDFFSIRDIVFGIRDSCHIFVQNLYLCIYVCSLFIFCWQSGIPYADISGGVKGLNVRDPLLFYVDSWKKCR